MNNKADCQINC